MNKKEFIESTLTLDELAEYLGYESKETLRLKVKKGLLPGFKSGRSWRFRMEKVLEYVIELENKTNKIIGNKNDRHE